MGFIYCSDVDSFSLSFPLVSFVLGIATIVTRVLVVGYGESHIPPSLAPSSGRDL